MNRPGSDYSWTIYGRDSSTIRTHAPATCKSLSGALALAFAFVLARIMQTGEEPVKVARRPILYSFWQPLEFFVPGELPATRK